jgi:hypothetical protein
MEAGALGAEVEEQAARAKDKAQTVNINFFILISP